MTVAIVLGCVLACEPADVADESELDAPTQVQGDDSHLSRVYELTIRETDTRYVGRPAQVTIDPLNGDFLISDSFHGHVMRVDREGTPTQVYGRKGPGPEEFTLPAQALVYQGELVVPDNMQKQIKFFDRETGASGRAIRFAGVAGNGVTLSDGRLVLGLMSQFGGTSLAMLTGGADELTYLGAMPEEYVSSPPLSGIFNRVFVEAWNDTIALGWQGLSRVEIHTPPGVVSRTVQVPVERRKGLSDEVLARFDELSFPDQFGSVSALFGLHRTHDGDLLLVHFDQALDGRAATVTAFVSAIATDASRSCVDVPLPVSQTAQPKVTFRGDTIFVLEQTVTESDQSATIVGYLLDTDACGA